MKRIFPSSFYNLVTLIGSAIAAVSFGLIVFLMLLEAVATQPKPYMGIIAFVILPVFVVIGIILVVIGILREHRRERLGKPHGFHMPQIDFSNPRHRTAFLFFSVGGLILLAFSAFSSFQAYEHTDSDQFCGETCHKVMEPEYTAYQFSPHARVGCVKCHIGPGAGWFIRSKLSGTYQVYAVTFNKYPKPIPTPIENLRPAQETCEQCHWPKQFFSEKLHVNTYFLSDEHNTKWTLNLLMKIGGGNVEAGPTSGIHWHMNINNEVTYIPLDEQRQIIPWVRSKRPDGSVSIYRSTEMTVSDDSLAKAPHRRMDCIDPTIPSVKSVSVKALEYPYGTKQAGLDSIRMSIEEYYRNNYPNVASSKKNEIDRTITEVQRIYTRNYFPEMMVSWRKFPDNLGHLYYQGCFRCHDGKHVSEDGKVLSRDCNTCHTILAQQFENDTLRLSLGGIEYKHPVDIGDAWKEMNCSDCHFNNQ